MEIKVGKWRILAPGNRSETMNTAVYDLYGIVNGYLPYPLALSDEASVSPEALDENLILVGTVADGCLLKALAGDGFYIPETHAEGYSVKVSASPYRENRQVVILCGADDAGLLYAVHAFDREYLRAKAKYLGYHYNHRFVPFTETLPEWETRSYPKIERRGIWTWGHTIYDYRRYFRNMSALGLNLLVMWNDFAPVNARELLSEAHKRGIRIFWGFSCSWGETVHPDDPADVRKWTERVTRVYREEYLPLGGDGVYFQAFTETNEKTIGDKPIAVLVTDWANTICNALHTVNPALDIEFGIHATSIGDSYAALSGIDNDVAVMWEDCGDFPFGYDPAKKAHSDETLAYTEKLLQLNGKQTKFAVVLKGFTVLNWSCFEHYHGPIVVGEASDAFLRKRAREKAFTWQYARAHWMTGAALLKRWVKAVSDADIREKTVTALVEDGMLECGTDSALMLFSALLWDYDRDTDALLVSVTEADET